MSGPLRILLLAPDGRSVAAAAKGPVDAHVCADLSDLLGRAAAGTGDVVVVSPRSAGVDAAVVGRIKSLGCRAVALAHTPLDVDLARRIGLQECAAAPLDATVLRAMVQSTPQKAEPAASAGAARRGQIVAVWGPPGSPGRTTITGLLAVGARRAGRSVVIVDADLCSPSWGMMCPAAATGSGLLVAARRAVGGVLDASDLLADLAPGIAALPMPAEPERWTEVVPAAVAPILAALAAQSDTVIVDLGADIRSPHPAYDIGWAHDSGAVARAVLAAADTTAAVVSADPVGVHRFAIWWPILRACAAPGFVVANRLGLPRAGKRPAQQISAVLAALGAEVPYVPVPWLSSAADALVLPGWWHARGWGGAPDELYAAAATAGAPLAAVG